MDSFERKHQVTTRLIFSDKKWLKKTNLTQKLERRTQKTLGKVGGSLIIEKNTNSPFYHREGRANFR